QQDLEFLVGFLERGADLANDFAQLTTGNRHADDIAKVGPDRRERGMADPLEVSNLGRELRADQAALLDVRRHRGPKSPPASVAPVLGTGVLLEGQRWLGDVDLLHDLGEGAIAVQAAATARAGVEMVLGGRGEPFRRNRRALVLGMAGLAAD